MIVKNDLLYIRYKCFTGQMVAISESYMYKATGIDDELHVDD
jgi:hypothetical protein